MRIDRRRGVARLVSSGVSKTVLRAFAGVCVAGALAACSDSAPKGAATLEPGAFRAPEDAAAAQAPAPTTAPVKTITQNEAAAGFLDITSLPGAPATTAPAVTPVGNEVIVDQFIGQINGRAMMASDFFGDGFGDRLRAMGKDEKFVKRPGEWTKEANKAIAQRLNNKIENGLLLDEVYSAMEPEMRQGLRFAVESLKNRIVSGNEGSAQLTDERVRQEKGQTLDEFVADQRDFLLMKEHLDEKVRSRVNVSWQQVKDEHERLMQEAMNNRILQFKLISVSESKIENVQLIKDKLASGVSFDEVSESAINEYGKPDERFWRVPLTEDLEHTKVFQPPPLNDAAKSLSPGQTAPPVVFQGNVYWIHFDRVVMDDVKSLYDGQLEIIEQIRASRSAQKTDEYFGRLMEKSSLTPVRKMQERLLAIAVSRYAPAGARPVATPTPAPRGAP